jgi:hypothetical protein
VTDTATASNERRDKSRRRVLKRALIVFQGGHCSMRCQILNISDVGAQLMPSDILLCPSEFVLKPEIGDRRNCEVVWRRGTNIGVRFV